MAATKLPTLFLTLLPLLRLTVLFSPASSIDLIQQTCSLTPFYDLCIGSLQSDPQSSSSDLRGLAQIMASAVLANANQTLTQIQQLLNQAPDPAAEKPLAYCAEIYIPMVKYNLPQAIAALRKGGCGFAVYVLSAAQSDVSDCQKRVAGSSPVSQWNKMVQNLADVALSIIEILQKTS